MGLQQFERRLERLVEGVFARAFRGGLQPVEVGRRLTREMDLRRTVAPRGTITPNRFRVVLSPADHSKFAPIADELIAELVSVARDHARSENYVLLGQITVNLETDPSLPPGTLTVTGDMDRNRGPSDPDRNRGPGDMDRQRGPGDGDRNRGPAVTDRDRGPSDMDRSQSRGAAVVLPDGRRISVGSRPLAMGRLPDCDVVLADPNVSRRHVEIRPGPDGTFLLADLGSTNGTRVNGVRINGTQPLYPGDQITVGATTLQFESA